MKFAKIEKLSRQPIKHLRLIASKPVGHLAITRFSHPQLKKNLTMVSSSLGTGACPGVIRGKVRVVNDPRNATLEEGEILVAQQTDPGWVVLFPAASGLLVERGSLLSHSAIVARELQLPCIVSIPNITTLLTTGTLVEMNGSTGEVKIISS